LTGQITTVAARVAEAEHALLLALGLRGGAIVE